MKYKQFRSIQAMLVSGAAVLALCVGAGAIDQAFDAGFDVVSKAQAESKGQSAGSKGMGAGGGGVGGQGSGRQGDSTGRGGAGDGGAKGVEDRVFRGKATLSDDSEGRGPAYSGGGDRGGPPEGSGTMKGDLYGDMVLVLRDLDNNGVPILDEYGHVQPLDKDGVPLPLNEDGEPIKEDGTPYTKEELDAILTEVELGRLSVGRSPEKVLDHALSEAEKTIALDADGVIEFDAAGRIVVVAADGTVYTIDSPLENLALYEQALTSDEWTLAQAASFLGAASGKEVPISVDSVYYMDAILAAGTLTDATGATYVDFTTFAYDRSDTYSGEITYAVMDPDTGAIEIKTEPVLTAVFDDQDVSATGVVAFATAADDARAVIEFVHSHPLPATE